MDKQHKCKNCGSVSFSKTDNLAVCDYCGATYDMAPEEAAEGLSEAEKLVKFIDNIDRLRQLAEKKEKERQAAELSAVIAEDDDLQDLTSAEFCPTLAPKFSTNNKFSEQRRKELFPPQEKTAETKQKSEPASLNCQSEPNNQPFPKNPNIAAALCIFLGLSGAHKFYEGKYSVGALYLIMSLLGPLTGGITIIIVFISCVVDLVKLNAIAREKSKMSLPAKQPYLKSPIIAAALCIFLGLLGAHKIYEEKYGVGALYLIMSLLGPLTHGITITIVIISCVVDLLKLNDIEREKSKN